MPRIEKAPVFGVGLAHLVFAHILAMDVADPLAIGAREPSRIAAAPARVSGVEQEMHRRPGVGHERVDVALRLDDRAHVVMVAEFEPLSVEAIGEFGHLRAEAGPVAFAEPGSLGEGSRPVAVDGVRRLRRDDDGRAGGFRHRDMGLGRFELLARGARQKFRRAPAADEDETELCELLL
jgi:hypothetical protein